MPKWLVEGADLNSGKDRRLSIRAGTQEEAEQIARKHGVLISGSKIIEADPVSKHAPNVAIATGPALPTATLISPPPEPTPFANRPIADEPSLTAPHAPNDDPFSDTLPDPQSIHLVTDSSQQNTEEPAVATQDEPVTASESADLLTSDALTSDALTSDALAPDVSAQLDPVAQANSEPAIAEPSDDIPFTSEEETEASAEIQPKSPAETENNIAETSFDEPAAPDESVALSDEPTVDVASEPLTPPAADLFPEAEPEPLPLPENDVPTELEIEPEPAIDAAADLTQRDEEEPSPLYVPEPPASPVSVQRTIEPAHRARPALPADHLALPTASVLSEPDTTEPVEAESFAQNPPPVQTPLPRQAQQLPADMLAAGMIDASKIPVAKMASSRESPRHRIAVPEYSGLRVLGITMRVVAIFLYIGGAILVVLSALANQTVQSDAAGKFIMFSTGIASATPIVVGLIVHAFGEAAMALRDIAQNSFRK